MLVIVRHIFNSVQKKLKKHIQQQFQMDEIIGASTRANFFGTKSLGSRQLRGNGALVLTKDNIYFVRSLPSKEYSVPLKNIREISLPKSFNGKSVFRRLLCVHYYSEGQEDAIAWAVDNPEKWKTAIEALIQN